MNLAAYYEAVSDIRGESFTEKEFSARYLGKSDTYYAYLKCTRSEPSKTALIHLWHQLKRDTDAYAQWAESSGVRWLAEDYERRSWRLEGLCEALLQDIMWASR